MGPCEFCGSSDAFASYDDGVGTCFSCNKSKKLTEERNEPITYTNTDVITNISSYASYPVSSRGLSQEVIDHYSVKMSTTPDGNPGSHYYPYTKKGEIVAYKERMFKESVLGRGKIYSIDYKNYFLFCRKKTKFNKWLTANGK